jgi:hypothetical protein
MLGDMVRNQESPLAARGPYFGMTKWFNCTAKVFPDGKSLAELDNAAAHGAIGGHSRLGLEFRKGGSVCTIASSIQLTPDVLVGS